MMLLLLPILSGCSRLIYYGMPLELVYYEGDYHGKVIDAETLQPIESAVVLGVWYKEYATVGGPVGKYYDARETVTDKNGDFTIEGMGIRFVTHLQKTYIVFFKAGYDKIGPTPWETLKTSTYLRDRMKWDGEKAIIALKKLPLKERLRRLLPNIDSEIPSYKQKMMRKEIEKELLDRGKLKK